MGIEKGGAVLLAVGLFVACAAVAQDQAPVPQAEAPGFQAAPPPGLEFSPADIVAPGPGDSRIRIEPKVHGNCNVCEQSGEAVLCPQVQAQTVTSFVNAGDRLTYAVPMCVGSTYRFHTCNSSNNIDTVACLWSPACGGTVINDRDADACATDEEDITFSPTVSGCYILNLAALDEAGSGSITLVYQRTGGFIGCVTCDCPGFAVGCASRESVDQLEAKADALEGKADVLEGKADVLEGKADALEAKQDSGTLDLDYKIHFEWEDQLCRAACIPSLWLPEANGGRAFEVHQWVVTQIQNARNSLDPNVDTLRATAEAGMCLNFLNQGRFSEACKACSRALRYISRSCGGIGFP